MLKKTILSATAAAAGIGALVQMAAADDLNRVHAKNLKTQETQVYEPARGMSYTIGSNRVIGYFEHAQGRCDLTLMLFEQTAPDGTPDMSATRVQVSVSPGENARIDSAEGEAVELSCNSNGERVSAARFDQATQSR